ncbi:MAG TPA: sugar phosphate isomerase/epimerase family protein [Tepidisphaeraceae bacterium]|jgi:sugar phosphate isomerase/epimerase|nr:sugar phosphate isomerase/epimerase family protein [Tepidisphaeraceae bacterium]
MSVQIAFNSANLVAHYSGYQFKLAEWGKQHELASQRTGIAEWNDICQRIRACGYDAIEVWVALVERCETDEVMADAFAKALRDNQLKPAMLAGTLNDKTATICKRLGIPAVAGGYWGSDKATATRVMRATGIHYNFENHPEDSIDAIRQRVDYGANGFAVALDTGWLGTKNMDAPDTVRQLGRLIRHVHLKDVKALGGHETVKLGTGVVDIPGVIRELKAIGYTGVLSWEDEPEDRNPFDIAAEMRQYIAQHWAK